jgi:hypothetical protein
VTVTHFSAGDYRFLAAPGRPFSSGVVAEVGFDLVHARFFRPLPLEAGLEAAARHVESTGRPVTAIAAFELRIPRPFSEEGFAEFNAGYVRRLERMGLTAQPDLPTGRTNVAPIFDVVSEPSVYAFTYTVPAPAQEPGDRPAFRLSGSAETRRDGPLEDRFRSVVETLTGRLAELGVRWEDSTAINLYAAAQAPREVEADMVAAFGLAALHGITWMPALPPVTGLQFEIDARRVGSELIL